MEIAGKKEVTEVESIIYLGYDLKTNKIDFTEYRSWLIDAQEDMRLMFDETTLQLLEVKSGHTGFKFTIVQPGDVLVRTSYSDGSYRLDVE